MLFKITAAVAALAFAAFNHGVPAQSQIAPPSQTPATKQTAAMRQTALMQPLFPQRTIFWFNNYDPGRTVWNEAQVYHSADTTVRTATSASHDFQVWRDTQITGLPVETVDGVRSLVIDTINPGDWNLHFIMGSGNVVNLDRIGPAPVLHLRVK